MNHVNHANRTCPSLGLKDDAGSSLAFPSNWNYCHRCRPIGSVRLKHQEEFCLGGKYLECPVFLSRKPAPLPGHIRALRGRAPGNNSRRNLVIALTVVIAVLALGWGIMSRKVWPTAIWGALPAVPASVVPVATAASLPAMPASVVPTLTSAVTLLVPSGSATLDGTSTFAHTATPTSSLIKRRLDMPIGTDYKFVIHRVSEGENLEQYAAQYNTSVEAILLINYNLRNPAWTDVLVVIPVGFTNVANLPIFVVYQVKEEERGISVEALAKKLRVDPLDLKYYNGMTELWDRPLVGDLFLVPWPRPAPP